MNRKSLWGTALMLLVGSGLFLLGGCSKDSQSTAPSSNVPQTENLSTQNGGLTATDEAPGFGDQSLVASVSSEAPQSDALAQDATVQNIEAGRTTAAQIYAVTILWGMLQAPDSLSDGNLYDWTGNVTSDHGIMVLKSVVSFEAGDHMNARGTLLARQLSWVSHTGTSFDGIRFLTYVADSSSSPTLTLTTPLFTGSFALSRSSQVDTLVSVDRNGNSVRVIAFPTVPGTASNQGYLQGRWSTISAGDSLAHFTGLWVSDRGSVLGYVRGHFGITVRQAQGQKSVFFAKYIDLTGRFRGILRGNWAETGSNPDLTGSQLGTFVGEWVDAAGSVRGQVKGDWGTVGAKRTFFSGRWCQGCSFGYTGS